MELKPIDYKLLAYLYHNNREPITRIAKATGLSRDQVEYKINKWIKEGFIKKFVTIFNYPKLGYNKFVVILFNVRDENLPNFLKSLEIDKNCVSIGENIGNYNVYGNFIFKDGDDMVEYYTKFFEDNKDIILNYNIFEPFFSEIYPMKPIENKDKKSYRLDEKSDSIEKIGKRDEKILSLLEKDGRMKLVDIAHEVGISAELAFHKIRKFLKKGIVLGNRLDFDFEKLGYSYSVILINVNNLSLKNQNKIKKFAKENDHINSIILTFGKPGCILQVFHKEQEILLQVIKDIKRLLGLDFHSYDLMFPQREHKLNTLPFMGK